MTPPVGAAARRPVPGRAATPARLPASSRPPLRVVTPAPRRRRGRRPVAVLVSVAMLAASMITIVVGHALLAQGQVRLTAAQAALAAEQVHHRQQQLATARLEMPSRIVQQAEQQLHMVRPTQVTQVPSVPLDVPLGTGSAPQGAGSTATPPAAK